MSKPIKDEDLEREGYEEEKPVDTIWVMNGRGKMVKLEVDDDVADDTTR